ncbi:DnaJ-domain-containing protein [Venturia nashicola]|uniref:DnaJ-domain-containing protein n=1 Tax=Venturia nashicola TaxID=86259 RepID=A0A4Z1NR97_9PEZI|nr:DnaJ-domain-containing protein [Venturia nashicola]
MKMILPFLEAVDVEEVDLYELLSIDRNAGKTEIKKAYHRIAKTSHPDKVAEHEREASEAHFKAVKEAYDILSDEQTRHIYDTHGMAGIKGGPGHGHGGAGGPDMEDILAQMFGGMGGPGGFPGMGGAGGPGMGRRGPAKGANEGQIYEVSLEELFKGKTTRFANTKNVVCSTCAGTGGKEKSKPIKCGACGGAGARAALRQTSFGVMQETVQCGACDGRGQAFKEKDKCKKCKGKRVVQTKKMLELYIPRGSRQGDKIVLAGEADQVPDQEPGDIIFQLQEIPHKTFKRAGADLVAEVHVTLAEALTGFSRVVLTHLDGRGIQLSPPKGKILRPDQVLKIPGEGMPIKKSDARGDLYLSVTVDFPEDGWFKDSTELERIKNTLPGSTPAIKAEHVDELEYEDGDLEDFGAGSDDPRGGAEWEDDEDDDEEGEPPQCQQQ